MNEIDVVKDVEMYLKQIVALCNLMLEVDIYEMPNILTIMDIAEQGISKLNKDNSLQNFYPNK